jgi:hypothetical protein
MDLNSLVDIQKELTTVRKKIKGEYRQLEKDLESSMQFILSELGETLLEKKKFTLFVGERHYFMGEIKGYNITSSNKMFLHGLFVSVNVSKMVEETIMIRPTKEIMLDPRNIIKDYACILKIEEFNEKNLRL